MRIIKEIQNGYKLVELNSDHWQLYRAIRLEALEKEPQAFASNLAKESSYSEDKWRSRLLPYSDEHKSWNTFLADQSGEIVGMTAAYETASGEAEIVSVYLTAKARGLGLSKILMDSIQKKIQETGGYKTVRTGVNKEQLAALHLYHKLGFEKDVTECQVLGDGKTHEVWYLSKKI